MIGRILAMQNKQGFLRTAVIALSDRAIRETELKELVKKLELQLAKVQEFVNSSRITELLQILPNSDTCQQSSACAEVPSAIDQTEHEWHPASGSPAC